MSGDSVLANLEAIEATLNGAVTHTLKRKSRKLVITNDSPTAELNYKFNESEDYASLKGTESLSMYFTTNKIYLTGNNVPYRVWVFG